MLEIRHLMGIHMLRETGSLHEAAKKLHVTQSALSLQFSGLEKHLGSSLFERRTRPVQFTRIGRRILKLADSLLPQLRSVECDLVDLAETAAGRITMAVESSEWAHWLIPLINRFREEWPEIELDMVTQFPRNPGDAVSAMDVDLLLCASAVKAPGVISVPLFTYELLLGVANTHPLASKVFITPEDLATETLITSSAERSKQPIFEQFLGAAGVEPARHRSSDALMSVSHQVSTGRAVCCLPDWVIRGFCSQGRLVFKSLGMDGLHVTLNAVLSLDSLEAPHMRYFLLAAQEGPRG
ncbi:LysR substrate-binding domain-containing protein [Pseudomonas fluorescens]